MTNLILTAKVDDIRYGFVADGAIHTFIDLYPAITLPDGVRISRLASECIANADTLSLGRGDVVRFVLDESTTCNVEIERTADSKKQRLLPDVCPCCGSKLMTIGKNKCCINRGCPGQQTVNILTFTAGLGMSFGLETHPVLDILLTRGVLLDPTFLFGLATSELQLLPGITATEAQIFQQYIHSVRGKVTLVDLLRSLHIPNWDDNQYITINQYAVANGYNLRDVAKLLDAGEQKKIADVDWKSFNAFVGIANNKRILLELADILFA